MPSVKSLEWNPSVDLVVKPEFLDNANTFFGFQVPAGFQDGREDSLLTPGAVTHRECPGRVAGNTEVILGFVMSALRMKKKRLIQISYYSRCTVITNLLPQNAYTYY